MTRDVKTCTIHDSLNGAARIMWDHDCGCAPVVDAHGKLVGIVTDRDICMAAYTQGVPLGCDSRRARDVPEGDFVLARRRSRHRASPDAHARDSPPPGGRYPRPADRDSVVERRHKSLAWGSRSRAGSRDRGNVLGDSPPPRARQAPPRHRMATRTTEMLRANRNRQRENARAPRNRPPIFGKTPTLRIKLALW